MFKSFLQNAGIIEGDASETVSEAPVTKPSRGKLTVTASPAAPTALPYTPQTFTPAPGFGVADPTIVAELEAVVNGSKAPGYAEFKATVETLAALPETQRIGTALALVHNVNKITPQTVLAALDDRLAMLDSEQKEFESVIAAHVDTEVTQKQTEADEISKAIEAAKADIQAKEQQRAQLISEATQAQNTLNAQNIQFAASINAVRAAINAEREKIAAHFPTTPTK